MCQNWKLYTISSQWLRTPSETPWNHLKSLQASLRSHETPLKTTGTHLNASETSYYLLKISGKRPWDPIKHRWDPLEPSSAPYSPSKTTWNLQWPSETSWNSLRPSETHLFWYAPETLQKAPSTPWNTLGLLLMSLKPSDTILRPPRTLLTPPGTPWNDSKLLWNSPGTPRYPLKRLWGHLAPPWNLVKRFLRSPEVPLKPSATRWNLRDLYITLQNRLFK